MDFFFQQLISATALGGTYALLALGLAIVFSIVGLINFAHGELMTITAYAVVLCTGMGLPFMVAAPIGIGCAMLAAMLLERVAFRPVRKASGATLLVTSFAAAMILQTLFQNFISQRPLPVVLPELLTRTLDLGGFVVGVNQILSIVIAAATMLLLNLFLKRSLLGLAMRAIAQDFGATRLMGVRADAVISGAFSVSGLLAGVAAILWVSQRASVDAYMGFVPVLKAFIAAIIGGLGSLTGAVAGGLVLGFIEIFLAAYLPDAWQEFREPLGLGLVIAILLVRPHGMLPAAHSEKV